LKIAILLPLKIVISLPRSAFSQRMRSWFASGATGIGLALKTPSLNGAGPQGLKLTMTGRTVSRHRAAISARRAPRTMMPQDDDVERLGSTLDLSGPRQRTVSPGICVARYRRAPFLSPTASSGSRNWRFGVENVEGGRAAAGDPNIPIDQTMRLECTSAPSRP
jgi:hypothetical protein